MTPSKRQAGDHVPDQGSWIGEHFFRTIARIWCWREFTLPVLTVIGLDDSGHHVLGHELLGLIVLVLVPLLLFRPSVVLRAWRRCHARSQALSTQYNWPGLCEQLGWSRRLPSGGRIVPALIDWVEDNHQVRVRLQPLAEHTQQAWDQMADAIRRLVGGESVQWRETRGVLTVTVSRHALPTSLAWTAGQCDRQHLVIGALRDGAPLALDVARSPHVLLAGATGAGKGGAIRCALAGALQAGWQPIVLDPKESGEYEWARRLAVPILTSIGDQVLTLEVIDALRERRQTVIRAHGADSWHEVPVIDRSGWRPILVVVDEAADLLTPVKGRSEQARELAAVQQRAASLITQLARKGRSAGIHLIVAIQRPDITQLGDAGGVLRNNLTARLALGRLDSDGLRMLGITANDPAALALDGTPGRGVCVGFGNDPRPSVCQVAWLDQHQACEQVLSAAPQGLGSMVPLSFDPLHQPGEELQ
ncbi:MAG: FtsK/SpoIIIE domain-containing protein [Solirubrobacteraceae bacterium]